MSGWPVSIDFWRNQHPPKLLEKPLRRLNCQSEPWSSWGCEQKLDNGSSFLDRRLLDQSSDNLDVRVGSGHDLGSDRDRQAHRSGGLDNRSVSRSGWLLILVPLSCGVAFIRVGLKL
jgi:hypothetical protein